MALKKKNKDDSESSFQGINYSYDDEDEAPFGDSYGSEAEDKPKPVKKSKAKSDSKASAKKTEVKKVQSVKKEPYKVDHPGAGEEPDSKSLPQELKFKDLKEFIAPVTSGRVIKVYDGDTITIASKVIGLKNSPIYKFPIRLNGIDTPEIKG